MRIKCMLSMVTALIVCNAVIYAGGGIKGTIKYVGNVPTMKSIKMEADPKCASKHSEDVKLEWLLAGENGELKNVFVYVKEGISKKYSPPEETAVIDQNGCVYLPHILGVQAGQTIEILNNDGTLHNVHAVPKVNREFNIAMPKFRKKMTAKFDKPEVMVRVKCDVHPWMGCWVGVVNHPFYAVTGDEGTYEITGLQDGTYTIESWHEKLGTQTTTVTITGDAVVSADFTFTKPSKK